MKQMNKLASVFKTIVKMILWIVISFVLLFISLALLIQIPAIQNKIVDYATSFISNKTHTKVEIENISISFPKSIVIEGLYLEDTQKDTLLYAEEIRVNIAFRDLFIQEIHISSFVLEDVNLNVNRIETDSLFNYDFLLTAFSDTSTQKKVVPQKKSKWTFGIDKISMKNIQLHYYDNYGGTIAAANLKSLELKMEKIDFENSIYKMDELLIENITANVLLKKSFDTSTTKSESVLPLISANKIQINNASIRYDDSIGKLSLIASINQFDLKDVSIDLQKEVFFVDKFFLSKSNITYNTNDIVLPDSLIVITNAPSNQSDWKVTIQHIALNDNSLAYNVENKLELKNTFDASHLDYRNLSLAAENFYYSSAKTEVSVLNFSTTDKNNFSITKFETDFRLDEHSITAKNLSVKTTNSSIDADFNIKYSSLNTLMDSIQFMIVNADLKNISIKNSDILYFNPDLKKQTFFKNISTITTVSGLLNGPINKLSGKDIVIKTGVNTILKTDFVILGLPDAETAYYNFPNLKINTGKKDIALIAGSSIPNSIELPENINMQIVFKGKIKSFESTVGMSSSFGSAQLFATIDKNENFKSNISILNFDLGRLLKDNAMFGTVTLTAAANGHGLDEKTMTSSIYTDVSQIYLNKYIYHNLNVDGNFTAKEFAGKINLNDENAVFEFDGLVNFTPNKEQYKFTFSLQGADLKKLNLSNDNMQLSLISKIDIKGDSVDGISGNAYVTDMIVVHDGKTYLLDSALVASINEPAKSKINLSNALVDVRYTGTTSATSLSKNLNAFINNYFPFSDTVPSKINCELANFNFEINLRNHPIISEVFFSQLKEFQPGIILGSYNSEKNELILNASINKMVYGTTEIDNLVLNVNSDVSALNYKVSCSKTANSQIKLDNLIVDGKIADKAIDVNISSIDSTKNKKLLISSQIIKNDANYKLMLDSNDFYLMNEQWNIATDNYVEFGKQGFLIHHLFINKAKSQINIASVHNQFNDDLNIEIKNFELDDISRIIEKDTSLVKGNVDGNVLLKKVGSTYGLIADAKITDLFVREVPIGNLSVKADNPTADKFDIDINLTGADNNLTANGYFIPSGGDNSVNIKAAIQSLSLKTVKAFSMGAITEASGNLTGNFLVSGKADSPDITGELLFDNVFITPAALNNQLQMKHETVLLKNDGISFNSFTILDPDLHKAIINGAVRMEHFQNYNFALNVNTKDFLLFNTTAKENKEFFGRMIIDSKIDVNGPLTLPVINAKLKMKKGSNFTFAVPEDELTMDKGKDVVEFNDTLKLNPILTKDIKKEKQQTSLTGYDVSSIIEIDKQATLRLLLDPSSKDSLVVKGDAALNFAIDRSGKMSLTGTYNLNEGSYIVSLEAVIKRKFDIEPGSFIIWNGDPLDANISINAIYSVRASPIDLVSDQMAGLSETDKNSYKQRYPFLVLLKLRGDILQPEISFEIQLPPEEKGILGGAVNAKLNLLNEDPSALNKQVFALLILGRFIQENPLQTETNGMSVAVRTTVGKFLSAQLNQWSSKLVPGVELNFDVQSYDDYQSGQAEGRTQVDIGIKKQLFNERFTLQVGGTVDVEGEKAKQNSASDITSDVTVEYKLTEDGRYRMKGFRHNQYEGAIEGQLVETGAGILYVRDFNKWKEFFTSPKSKSDSVKTNSNNEAVNSK